MSQKFGHLGLHMFTRNHAQVETIINELGLVEDNSEGTKSVKVKGVHNIDPIDGTPDDDTARYMTLAKAVVVDLISEDGIEGLVTHEYDFNQEKSRFRYWGLVRLVKEPTESKRAVL